MTKAIIVIDMPSSCEECSLSKLYGSYCCVMQSDTWATNGEISSDCPLKPMPEKKFLPDVTKMEQLLQTEFDIDTVAKHFAANINLNASYIHATGYNKCIDEILGEQEDE